MLEDSATAIALPLVYADQLHGVLYVESSEHCEFSEEERSFLRTLADLISGALHNALTFQKAQEQAITDGLTAVKTHRFFMEALSAEWKRSTRAGRTFSVMLIDLDRFKFVNDFHGHLEGDLVLQRVARILEQNCRRSDVVARYGGDEFVVLMPETNVEQGQSDRREVARLDRQRSGAARAEHHRELRPGDVSRCTARRRRNSFRSPTASMYLSKHQGGNTVSTADRCDPNETLQWKRDVLEAYLGVTLKRMFSTGPEAFEEISLRLNQFSRALTAGESALEHSGERSADGCTGHGIFKPGRRRDCRAFARGAGHGDVARSGHRRQGSVHAGAFAQGGRLRGAARGIAGLDGSGNRGSPPGRAFCTTSARSACPRKS